MINACIPIRTVTRAVLVAFGASALSLPALAAVVSPGTPSARAGATQRNGAASRVLPSALRAAFYRSLGQDAGAAYDVNANGCATLPNAKLRACFDRSGAHFTGAGSLTLHLVGYGRGQALSPVKPVRPETNGNRVSYTHGNLTEWWRALPVGFEQGFTLNKRLAGHGKLTLTLAANGPPQRGHDTLSWGKLHYGKLMVTDANGKVVAATLNNEGNRVLIVVNDTHAAYPLTVDPLVWLEQKVAANDGAANDKFGYAVALDGATAIVGAKKATIGDNEHQGAAYVFTKSGGTWKQAQKLIADDGAANNHFGGSVALGDSTVLIGAPASYSYPGAAYVFTKSGDTWVQTQKLTASDGTANNHFGISVALADSTLLVGAYNDTVGGNVGQGSAYVFTQSDGTWSQTQKLTASDGTSGAEFGWAVALDGTIALIGAANADVGGNGYQGAAYLFAESDGTWSQTQKLTANDGAAYDAFGYAVALDGATAVIGADGANSLQGASYVFTESDGTWTQTQKLAANDGSMYFGNAIALDGDTAVIGADGSNVDGNGFRGKAYVFAESGGTWTQVNTLVGSDGAAYDYFGDAVALAGSTVVVGAYNNAVGGNSGQGAAYFYGQSNLGLAVSAPETAGQGETYVSQTIATNDASVASPAVAVTVAVPAAASFVSATATQGSCSEDSGVVTCDFGQIEGNAGMATANVTLKATGSAGETIENTANVAKATPALSASTATEITSPATCAAGYTEFSGHLDAGESFTSDPIEVNEAGQKYVDLTSPPSFAFFATTDTRYGQHTYVYPHVKHGHRWGAAGTYQVGVQASPDAGGDYTLCVQLNPPQ